MDAAFHVEVIKLLFQLAFADDAVTAEERAMILGLGRKWGIPAAELEQLEHAHPLPAPNLALLRPRKAEVVELMRALAQIDAKLGGDEADMLEEIEALLG